MGKVIKKKIQGMNWLMKTGLVLLLTLTTMVFMYEGWYKPAPAAAATVTYGVTVPDTTSTGIDGLAQFPTAGATVATAPTVRGNMSTTLTTSAASYRPTTGMSSGTAVTMLKLYSPAYATAQTITAPSGNFAIRGYNTSDTWTFHVYSHNPAGVAGNKTLMYSSNTVTSGTGATVAVVPTYTLVNSAMPAGYKLLIEIVYTPGGTVYTPRIYIDGTTTTTYCQLTVTETAAATAGALAVSTATQTVAEAVGNATVSVTRTGGTTGAVTVDYATADVTALAGQDYTSTTGTLSWAAGDATAKTITVPIINDTYDEGTETFTVTLTNPTNGATLGTAVQTISITDDDATPTIALSAATSTGSRTVTPAVFTVNLSAASGQATSVNYATANGTATAGTDYTTTSGTLNIPALSTSGTINVPINAASAGGTFTVTLSAPTNATLGAITVNTYTITAVVSTITRCDGCHGYSASIGAGATFADAPTTRGTPTGQFQGSHNAHVIGEAIVCSTCHVAPATTTSADFGHSKGSISLQASINGGSYKSGTTSIPVTNTPSFGSCSGTSCHAQVYAATAGTSGNWGTAGGGCAACHNTTPGTFTGTGGGPVTGGHNLHMAVSGTVCDDCHTGAVSGVTGGALHGNGFINVSTGYTSTNPSRNKVAKRAAGGTYYTCNNASCHASPYSSASATTGVWGTGTGGCVACHNASTSPFISYSASVNGNAGKPVQSGPNTASHSGHMNYGRYVCGECHAGAVTGTSGGNKHGNGFINVTGARGAYVPAGIAKHAIGTYSATGCADACHKGVGGTANPIWGSLVLGCIDCHAVKVSSPIAAAKDATVATRPAITPDFALTSKHTRSRASATPTNNDCCVCHMEGVTATGLTNSFHADGYVQLRDPDTGVTIKAVDHSARAVNSAAGAWAATTNGEDAVFVRFKRNLGTTLEAETLNTIPGKSLINNFQVLGAIEFNFCLHCHDTNGANSTAAQIPAAISAFGTNAAWKPFNATIAANSRTGDSGLSGGVLNISAQFQSTNRSFHPVLVKQNNFYAGGTRMIAPWNGVVKPGSTGQAAATGANTVYGPLITCWDCHAASGATGTITTADIHGATPVAPNVVQLRGQTYVTSTTTAGNLCKNCHVATVTTNHGAGSAHADSTGLVNSGMTYYAASCYYCHGGASTTNSTALARPIGSYDGHGYNTRQDNVTAFAASNGYAFVRSAVIYTTYVHNARIVGATTYATATCTGATCRTSMDGVVILPGGVY